MCDDQIAAIECGYCGAELDGQEADSPRFDDDGDPICGECYHDHFEFTCCLCQEYSDISDQHNMLVVFDEEVFDKEERANGWRRGVYHIIDRPYYTDAMIGSGWLHLDCLDWIGPLPGDKGKQESWDGYPCGHLCHDCQLRVLGFPPEGFRATLAGHEQRTTDH